MKPIKNIPLPSPTSTNLDSSSYFFTSRNHELRESIELVNRRTTALIPLVEESNQIPLILIHRFVAINTCAHRYVHPVHRIKERLHPEGRTLAAQLPPLYVTGNYLWWWCVQAIAHPQTTTRFAYKKKRIRKESLGPENETSSLSLDLSYLSLKNRH